MKNLKLILTLLVGIALAFYMGNVLASAAGHQEYSTVIGVALVVLACIPKTSEAVAFDALSPDLSKITQYAAANKLALLRRFYYGLRIASDITLQPNVKNKLMMPMLVINGQPRPYTGNHKANAGDISYTDRELSVDDFQRDFSIDPSFYRNIYLSQERGPGEGANNQTIPFAQFTLETIIGENASSLNNTTAFNGLGKSAFSAFNAGTAYTVGSPVKFVGADSEPHYYVAIAATNAAESPASHPAKWKLSDSLAITEGLGTKIKAARTAQLIKNVAATGVITKDDAFEQALMVFRKLPQGLRDEKNDLFLYGAPDLFDMVGDSFGNDIQKYTSADGSLITLPRTDGKCKIKRASWMAGSGMFIASPKSNLYMGTDLLSDLNDLRTVPQVYKLDMGLKGVLGFQFADEQAIATNDQN